MTSSNVHSMLLKIEMSQICMIVVCLFSILINYIAIRCDLLLKGWEESSSWQTSGLNEKNSFVFSRRFTNCHQLPSTTAPRPMSTMTTKTKSPIHISVTWRATNKIPLSFRQYPRDSSTWLSRMARGVLRTYKSTTISSQMFFPRLNENFKSSMVILL